MLNHPQENRIKCNSKIQQLDKSTIFSPIDLIQTKLKEHALKSQRQQEREGVSVKEEILKGNHHDYRI